MDPRAAGPGASHGTCWVLTDGAAGNRRQALALGEALQPLLVEHVVSLRAPWAWAAPRRLPAGRWGLRGGHRLWTPPWPTLAIGCGRAAAWATRELAARSGGITRTVQILDPRIDPRHWDLVVAPAHDQRHGPNVLNSLGSLNPVDDAWLRDAREAAPQFDDLPQPRFGLLLGGARRGGAMDTDSLAHLLAALKARVAREGGSVMAVASRRTPAAVLPMVQSALRGIPGFLWTGDADGTNPYPAVLAWADRLVVTPDSVNMLSEACATGRPVHTLVQRALPPRLERFHAALRASRRLHDIDASTPPCQPVLREAAAIAQAVRQRLGL
jgi:uncharacterized protein